MNLRNGLGRRRQKRELFAMASFETMQDLFLSRTSNFIDDEEFLAHQNVMIVTPRKVWIPEISFITENDRDWSWNVWRQTS